MLKNYKFYLLVLPTLLLSFFILFLGYSSSGVVYAGDVCEGGDGFINDDGWIKIEVPGGLNEDSTADPGPNLITYDASDGKIITDVCVKGGNENNDSGKNDNGYLLDFTQDGTQRCITVSGIGNQSSKVERDSDVLGSVCAAISHASFKVGNAPVEPEPNWEIDKSAVLNPQCVVEGEDFFARAVYTITVSNTGNGDGYIEKVIDNPDEDILSSYISYVSDSGVKDNGTITWDFGTGKEVLAGGSFNLTYIVRIPESSFGEFTNTATAYPSDTDSISDDLDFDISCDPQREPSWQLTKTVVESCVEGEDGEIYAKGAYTIRIENTGNGNGYITRIVDELDSKVTEDYLYNVSDDWYFFEGSIIWESNGKGLLEPGKHKEFTYELLIPESAYGTYDNTVYAYSSRGDTREDTVLYMVASEEVLPVATDSASAELVCTIQQEYCEVVEEEYSDWSDWTVDPEDDTREMRTRTLTEVDAEDNSYICDETTIVEYRDIEDEGDVLGEDDYQEEEEEGEVLGTGIVYAQTDGGANLIIYIVEYILVILSGFGIKFVGKKYLTV